MSNAVRSIHRCAKHQDVDPVYVVLPIPDRPEEAAWLAARSVEQQTLPEPPNGES